MALPTFCLEFSLVISLSALNKLLISIITGHNADQSSAITKQGFFAGVQPRQDPGEPSG